MAKANIMQKFNSLRKIKHLVIFISTLAIIICILISSKASSFKSFLASTPPCNYNNQPFISPHHNYNINQTEIKETIEIIIHKIQQEIDRMRRDAQDDELHPDSKHASFLADVLGHVESLHESSFSEANNSTPHPLSMSSTSDRSFGDEYFLTEEIRKYIKIKPNRLKKQNFMGANGTFTSIGHACFSMRRELEEYMDYDVGDICNDDWKLAQKLMVHGCDPLPRRRCFALAPRFYTRPSPVNESLWAVPDDRNVRWSNYKCKNFTCLASNATKKGFFKCSDCFDLTGHEFSRWTDKPDSQNPSFNRTSEFSISEVLDLKRGEIRIGLDFSVGTGTFAARMWEQNVTIVSATVNLGAPFSETIALRGLVPLYLTVNQRLPFFDNTLDLVHTGGFLDGWVDLVLLDFVVYDWDRVLRPGGILWVDGFFCVREDLDEYLKVFGMLRYKRHKWVVEAKWDRNDDREVYFSAVLEKPSRPFR